MNEKDNRPDTAGSAARDGRDDLPDGTTGERNAASPVEGQAAPDTAGRAAAPAEEEEPGYDLFPRRGGAGIRFSRQRAAEWLSNGLFALALLALLAVLLFNALPTEDLPDWLSPLLSYTLLGGASLGLLVRVLAHRTDNHATASFALKLAGCILLLLTVLFAVLHRFIGWF